MTKKIEIGSPPTGGVAMRQDSSIEAMIQSAIVNNVPVETMERLLVMRRELKAEAAKEEFINALGQFQGDCPVIKKTKKVMNKDGRTVRYVYAPIDSIVEQIKRPLSRNGLSYRWETKQDKGSVTAICHVTHARGHTESSDFTVEVDPESYMTAPQKLASALTFAKRYTLCNALGISTGDEDTDATDVGKEPDANSVKAKIIFRLRALKEKTDTKENVESAVLRLTQLELKDENFADISARLQLIIDENNEN